MDIQDPREIYNFIAANVDDPTIDTFVNNVQVNVQDEEGGTALHLAIRDDNTAVVKALLRCPLVDVNIEDIYGNTSFDYALSASLEIFYSLIERPDLEIQKKDWHIVERSFIANPDDIDIAKLLNHPKFDINHVGNNDITPLMYMVLHGSPSIVEKFLQLPNIDISKQSSKGNTVLHFAVARTDIPNRSIELLLSHPDIEIDAVNYEGHTPLFFAVAKNNKKAVNMLLFRKADKTIVDHKGMHVIETTEDNKLIKILLGVVN